MSARDVIVIGLGSPDRGDDAIGEVVADRIRAAFGGMVAVTTREDPTALVHTWEGKRAAVVVDAVMSGRNPGTVRVMEAGAKAPPLPTHAFTASGRGGSHAFGLAGAVELSRALDTLPERVAIVGVEAGTFAYGHLSVPVREHIDAAVAAVADVLAQEGIKEESCVSEPSPK